MGFWGALGNIAGSIGASFIPGGSLVKDGIKAAMPAIAGGVGAAAGAASQSAAHNRGTRIDAGLEEEKANQLRQKQYMDSLVAREQEGRVGANDAFKNVQRAEYLGGAQGYTPKNGLPSYGFGPKAATANEQAAAQAMSSTALSRLQNGNPIPEVKDPGRYQIDPKNLNAGFWEKLGGIAGAGLTGYGALATAAGQNRPVIMDASNDSIMKRIAALQSPELQGLNGAYSNRG